MVNFKFTVTHRMLVKAATGTHGYDIVEIDVNNGTFRKKNVGQTETKIRVKKSILGEIVNLGGTTKPLGLDEIEPVANKFNEARVAAGFQPLVFRTSAEEDKKQELKEIRELDESLAQQARDVIPVE